MTTQSLRDLQHALAAVWSGADHIDAAAVADQLEDLGWTLSPSPGTRLQQDPLPLEASTKRLPKRRAS